MTITDRDRKILIVVAILAALAGYWFLLLSPKRAEVAQVDQQIAEQQSQLDAANARASQAEAAKASFASDYSELVRLGKAIPTTVDMPSLLVQLDAAADGTDIEVEKITAGDRVPAAAPAAAPQPPAQPEGAAAPGGEPASSAPGQAAEQAGETANDATDTTTSQPANGGSVPVGGGSAPASGSAPAGGATAPGLDTVPLDFAFKGTFFHLADFFHRLKRFVHVNGNRIVVRGRLMTIDSVTMNIGEDGELNAAVKATVYLAPKAEGATAGATPQGPAPAEAQTASEGSPAPPTAAVQP